MSTTLIAGPTVPATHPDRPDRRVSGRTSTFVFIVRSLRHTLRNVEALTMAIVLPVMLMLLFTFVFGGALEPGGKYVDYVVPGIILLCAGFGSASTAVDVADDMTNGIIERFRTMPLKSHGVITGHVTASLVRNLFATAVVIGVALLVGFRPTANPIEWLGALGLIALFILAITWLYAGVGLAANSTAAASGYGFALLFVPYLSSAFVPTDTMPGWLRPVAEHQPITPIIDTIRGLLTGTPIGENGVLAIGWCLLILIGSYIWGAWLFRRRSGRR
jgi:ABC-2 type transport system permease protein